MQRSPLRHHLLLALALLVPTCASGCADRAAPAPPGYSGPIASSDARDLLADLAGASFEVAPGALVDAPTGGTFTVGPFAVVPNPRTGKGPVVRLDGPSGAVWLPMETDGDVVDLVTRVRGTAPDGFGGRPSDAYRAAWARAPR